MPDSSSCFDEMVNLYKLQHAGSRNQNYEQILRILNDVLQGNVASFGVYLGGTPEFLMDTRRGLYQLSGAAVSTRRKSVRQGWPGRLFRPGAAIVQPDTPKTCTFCSKTSGGFSPPAIRRKAGARCGDRRVHAALQQASRRRLFPDAAEFGQSLRAAAVGAGAEPVGRLGDLLGQVAVPKDDSPVSRSCRRER